PVAYPLLLSSPTRRSSDLLLGGTRGRGLVEDHEDPAFEVEGIQQLGGALGLRLVELEATNDRELPAGSGVGQGAPEGTALHLLVDRKSTRLNSSHQIISYA